MTKPTYTARYDPNPVYMGDTLSGFTIKITDKETFNPIVPVYVHSIVKNNFGRVVCDIDSTIDEITGTVSLNGIPAETTAKLHEGSYYYEVEYTLDDASVRTYLTGSIRIIKDSLR